MTKRRRWIDWALAGLLVAAAVAIPASLLWIGREVPRLAEGPVRVEVAPPVAEVARLAREMKLITVSVDSTVRATRRDERWRGTAAATVEAPVRHSYGVDLSGLADGAFEYNYLTRGYVVTLPAPRRIASEVDGGHPTREEIAVTGTRFKKLAGMEQLHAAHKAIYDEAVRQQLPKDRGEEVRRVTREQVAAALGAIVGGDYEVRVKFEDE